MPYATDADLPASLRNHLPAQALDIYRDTFNHAFAAQGDKPDREARAPHCMSAV